MAGFAYACSSSLISKALSSSPPQFTTTLGTRKNQAIFVSYPKRPTTSPIFPHDPINLSIVTFARRKKNTPAITSKKNKSKTKIVPRNDVSEDGDFDEDSIEALFKLLEEDLKNDLSSEEGNDELTEEDLAQLEQELEEILVSDDELLEEGPKNDLSSEEGDDELTEEELAKLGQELEEALGSDDELSQMLDSNSENMEIDDDDDHNDDEEEKPAELKKWQLRRLASALKIGRRKTSIKSLAAELCLDRALVIELLRDPPPNLLLLSAALPDRIVPTTSEPEAIHMELSTELIDDVSEPEPEVKLPVHVMQSRWVMQKRLKKVQVETLERVYNRSKRPTNTMISSIVHVTNLPRKRVVKWFEDKRAEDGVPQDRLPFQRSNLETILTN